MGLTMINPLSQNTGMETIQPMSMMASCGKRVPITLIIASASVMAAPVFSRMRPMMVPRIITIPMLANMDENPLPMVFGMLSSGKPTAMARIRDIPIMARKGWTFHFEMEYIIRAMAMTKIMISVVPDIIAALFFKDREIFAIFVQI